MFAYGYHYDNSGHVEKKILPGGGQEGYTTHYWYGKAYHLSYMTKPALGDWYMFYLKDKVRKAVLAGDL